MRKTLGTILLVFALLLSDAGFLPQAANREVQAGAPLINGLLGLFRIGGALGKRNRVYREAGMTAEEINAYYDRHILQAQTTRQEMIARVQSGELSPEFINSYIRLEAALEAERRVAIQLIETEKNQARIAFEKNLVKEITNTLIAFPGAQRIISQAGNAVWEARQVVVSVQRTLEEGKPTDMLGDLLASKVGDIEVAQELARGLGSVVGQQIDKALGGAIERLERAIENLQADLEGGVEVLDEINAEIDRIAEQGRQPASLVEDGSMIGQIFPVDRQNPLEDVVASAFAGATMLSGRNDPATTRASMRDRIRGALLDERVARIRELISGRAVGKTYCSPVEWEEYEAAAQQLGQAPKPSANPETTRYIVCYDIPSRRPVYARSYGSTQVAEEPPAETQEVVVQPTATEVVENPIITYEGVVTPTSKNIKMQSSQVLIEVSGETVTVTIEMTFSAAVKWTQTQVLCTATMNRVYSGQGRLGTDIEIKLDLQSHQDSLEGSDCKDAVVPVVASQTLTGKFHEDGSFTGNIRNVWEITAQKLNP
jgi:hypothetical protein